MADGDVTSGGGDAAGTDAELICGLQEALAVEQAKNQVLLRTWCRRATYTTTGAWRLSVICTFRARLVFVSEPGSMMILSAMRI